MKRKFLYKLPPEMVKDIRKIAREIRRGDKPDLLQKKVAVAGQNSGVVKEQNEAQDNEHNLHDHHNLRRQPEGGSESVHSPPAHASD